MQYRVFIGSPSGLDEERDCFRSKLEIFSVLHAQHQGVMFSPVGWEDTLGGVGRPQVFINEDLKQCDYAVFIFHDRWGSPTGAGYTSGTEEELALAEKLYKDNKIRNIALFFKKVDSRQILDPGKYLEPVLAFRKRVEQEKRYLFKDYQAINQFSEALEGHLARWLRDHGSTTKSLATGDSLVTGSPEETSVMVGKNLIAAPKFSYWIREAHRCLNAEVQDFTGAMFCANKAADTATSDVERARAKNTQGVAWARLGDIDEAIKAFTMISDENLTWIDTDHCEQVANALLNKALMLSTLGRSADEIAVYDDLLARFSTATELPLREQVATALLSKGIRLGTLSRNMEAIVAFDDLLDRFGSATELSLRKQVAKTLINKAFTFGVLNRSADEIAIYDDLLARFGTATEPALLEGVARALFGKGVSLSNLGCTVEAITVYDDLLARFGTATELTLREQVVKALFNKGVRLGTLGRIVEEMAVYDDLLARFGTATELSLREQVANVLLNKGITLDTLGRTVEAIAAYDNLLDRFGTATELSLRERVANALFGKGVKLGNLGRTTDEIATYDDLLTRFGTATELPLRELVAKGKRPVWAVAVPC